MINVGSGNGTVTLTSNGSAPNSIGTFVVPGTNSLLAMSLLIAGACANTDTFLIGAWDITNGCGTNFNLGLYKSTATGSKVEGSFPVGYFAGGTTLGLALANSATTNTNVISYTWIMFDTTIPTSGTVNAVTTGVTLAANQDVRNVLGGVVGTVGQPATLPAITSGTITLVTTTTAVTNDVTLAANQDVRNVLGAVTGAVGSVTGAVTVGTDNATTTRNANLVSIMGSLITGTAAWIAGAFGTFFNVAAPVSTTSSANQGGDAFTRIGANGAGLSDIPGMATTANQATLLTTLNASNSILIAATGSSGLTQQQVADAMNFTPTGTIHSGSVINLLNGLTPSGFAGIYATTFLVTDTANNPLQGVSITVSNNSQSHTYQSNAAGNATDSLNAATYHVAAAIPNNAAYSFTPTTFTVAGAGTVTLAMQFNSVAPPSNPSDCLLYGYTYDQAGIGVVSAIRWELLMTPNNVVINHGLLQSDATGYYFVNVNKGTGSYRFTTTPGNQITITSINTTNNTYQVT